MPETPSPPPAVDPITLEVVKNALASTADEMALVVMRSAYSRSSATRWITRRRSATATVASLRRD